MFLRNTIARKRQKEIKAGWLMLIRDLWASKTRGTKVFSYPFVICGPSAVWQSSHNRGDLDLWSQIIFHEAFCSSRLISVWAGTWDTCKVFSQNCSILSSNWIDVHINIYIDRHLGTKFTTSGEFKWFILSNNNVNEVNCICLTSFWGKNVKPIWWI